MNIYTHLIVALVVAGALATSHYFAYERGIEHQIAEDKKVEDLVRTIKDEAEKGAANAISKIELKSVTIQGRVEREIRTNTVYADCKHTDDGLRALNEVITGNRPVGAGKVKLPQPASAPAR